MAERRSPGPGPAVQRRRLVLATALSVALTIAAVIAYLLVGTDGLLAVLLLAHVALLLLVLRVWWKLDARVQQLGARSRDRQDDLHQKLDRLEQQVEQAAEAGPQRIERTLGRRVDRAAWRSFEQVDALLGLYHAVRPTGKLPSASGWAAAPDLLRHLYDTVREQRPQLVVELGSGASTVVIAAALRDAGSSGRLVSLDHDPVWADRTRSFLTENDLGSVVDLRIAPLVDVTVGGDTRRWYDPDQLPDGTVDLLIVDGPPKDTGELARYPAVPVLADQLRPGSIVVLDDYDRADERAIVERWLTEHPTLTLQRLPLAKGAAELRIAEPEA